MIDRAVALTVLACQVEIPTTTTAADRDAHVEHMAAEIATQLAARPADLVVLPELCSISYDRETFERLDDLSESLDGSSVQRFSQLAKATTTTVVFGMARRVADGHRISQVVIGADGLLKGHYDKLHAAHYGFSMEKDFFVTGDSLFTFDVNGYRVAPIICYDIRFPELSRTLSLDHGADLILHCSAFGRDESFDSWHAFVTARSMENQVYVLGLSRAGTQWGGSVLAGPWVDSDHPLTRLPDHHESFTYLTIERSELDRVRNGYTFREDRRDDYGGLEVGRG